MATVQKIPTRDKVKKPDTWDLSSLFSDDKAWETAFKRWEKKIDEYARFRGHLGDDAKTLARCLKCHLAIDREGERLGIYAFLRTTEDQANGEYQRMQGRFINVASLCGQKASYIQPEVMAIPAAVMKKFLKHKAIKPYRLLLERMLRHKQHTLGKKEENLLAMQTEMARAAGHTFNMLHDADMKFGMVKDEKGVSVELSNATFGQLLQSPSRPVRRNAFTKYYEQYITHENTLAATLSGSIQKDIYYARARKHESALARSLFADNVPVTVYDNLISAVHGRLGDLYRYYDLRRRKLRLRDIHQYDTYVPILSELRTRKTWSQAVKMIISALAPLGDEYCKTLEAGLTARWCDRYPNQGKQSGAFSCGSFDGDPYILMNYKPTVLEDVFTLAHEAGHSMHSFYSAANQPYQYYDYTIFVAEVASTFNEQLLSHYMLEGARDDKRRAYIINRDIDAIRGTIIRQTMFAEFEKITHEMAEAGEPLTADAFKSIYRQLLGLYFGPDFVIDDQLALECFRIPHFYRAFYVYKYATGLSAAISLSRRVLAGGEQELQSYLGLLKSGCSKFPIDLLRDAGVDMESPEPVDTALAHFGTLVDELEELL